MTTVGVKGLNLRDIMQQREIWRDRENFVDTNWLEPTTNSLQLYRNSAFVCD